MSLSRTLALIVVALAMLFIVKSLAATWLIFALAAAGLAIAAGSGAIGKWGYAAAALCLLVAVPGFFVSFMFKGLAIALQIIKMAPFLLVILGIWWFIKSR